MAYLGGKPFSGLSQRQIDSLRQIFKQAPADCSDGLWRLVYDSVGPAESYSASALLSAARQALWREGQFYWPPDIPFVENLTIAAEGILAANTIARMAAPARLSGGGSLSVDVTGGH